MKGTLYGIGVGPGMPEQITVQALDIIRKCELLVLPSTEKENCSAYNIVRNICPEIEKKQFLLCDFPMTRNPSLLETAQKAAAEKICDAIQNKSAAFLTIGDVTVYSTFLYVKQLVEKNDFEVKLINGVPSFCAVAARLGISLSEKDESIHIIPGSYSVENSFDLNGTLIFMKAGKKLLELKEFLLKKSIDYDFNFYGISNCGLDNEKLFSCPEELSENESYFTTVIVKNILKKNPENHQGFFQNKNCRMFPCHKNADSENFNCLFCYCPLYFLGEACGGNFKYTEKGIKSCIDCSFPHEKKNYEKINELLKKHFQKPID